MYGTELYIAIIIGTFLSLLYTEITGVLPAGLVVAGYFALMFNHPYVILAILFISCLTYLIVTHVVSRLVILYGRRKFVAMITVGIIIKLLLDYLVPYIPYEIYEISGIGVIIPGIIANTIQRQGFIHTMTSTLLVSAATYFVLYGYTTFFQ